MFRTALYALDTMAATQDPKKSLLRGLRRLCALLVLVALPFALSNCTKDQDEGDRELTLFLATCPAGPFVCYDNCFRSNDTDGNGIIQGSEEFGNNICNQQCSSQCSLAFLFYYLVDE